MPLSNEDSNHIKTPQHPRVTSVIQSPSNMDGNIDLAISPSKALAQLQTSQAWSQLTDWLVSIISIANDKDGIANNAELTPRQRQLIDSVERNEATQTWLVQAMQANKAADLTCELVHRARVEELERYRSEDAGRYERQNEGRDEGILSMLYSNLEPETGLQLDSLAHSCVLLGFVPASRSEDVQEGSDSFEVRLARSLFSLSKEIYRMENRIRDIESIKTNLESEIKDTNVAVVELEAQIGGEAQAERLYTETGRWIRETKQVKLKVTEYQERITRLEKIKENLTASGGFVRIEEVRTKEDRVENMGKEVKQLEEKLKDFYGLPPDIEASRAEVRRAQSELDHWKRRREELFETTDID